MNPHLTRQETAELLDTSVRTVDRYIASGLLIAEQVGTKRLVTRESINHFLTPQPLRYAA
jgi:excisionase family DNA binding protein